MVRHTKKHKKLRHSKRRSRGAGYSAGPGFVSPGYLINNSFSGPYPQDGLKDCTGNPHSYRDGYIFNYSPKGLPGLAGGGKRNRRNKKGGYQLAVAPVSAYGENGMFIHRDPALSAANSITPKSGDFPNTAGSSGTVANPDGISVTRSTPGVPTPPHSSTAPDYQMSKQAGGRYGFFPELGPLNPVTGAGTSPAQFGRIPCERGTTNLLNPDPKGVQELTTAPSMPPYMSSMRGGASIPAGSGLSASYANFPAVTVGAADMMRYEAPNAGYTNKFMTFPGGSPSPGFSVQSPYAAGSFNRACITTGGSRRKNKKRGGVQSVALDAGAFSPVTMSEVMNRKDFDGTKGGLPVKFGGSRRKHRRRTKRTKRHRRH
jgi:hypothetical protein